MGGDTGLRRAEDGVHAIEAFDRVTACAGGAFVTARMRIVEVVTARALHEVATCRRHIANLSRCAVQNRFRQDGIPCAYEWVGGEMAVGHERADAHAAVRQFFNLCERQSGEVNQVIGLLDVFAHQVNEIRAAAQELRLLELRDGLNGRSDVLGACVRKIFHRAISFSNVLRIASTIPTYAPQRHRLPLMRSLISASDNSMSVAARLFVTALGMPCLYSSTIPMAEQM